MKIRTLEQLNDCLSSDLAWRRKELASLSFLLRDSVSPDVTNALLRGGVTVLYSHWEGFVKAGASYYLEYVAWQCLTYGELTPSLVTLSVSGRLQHAGQTRNMPELRKVVEIFYTGLSDRCNIPYADGVEAKSNLSSKVLKEIICTLNLDYLPYVTKEKLVDERLLKNRNKAAHGERMAITVDLYDDLHDRIIEMMNTYKDQIESAAASEKYRRT